VETVRDCGFQGATFAPKRAGEVLHLPHRRSGND
jgi:hypothetical protein